MSDAPADTPQAAVSDGAIRVRRALLSVSDKTGVADFAKSLAALGVEILSTGGTATALNGPWENPRIRGAVGIPVVRPGISGVTLSAQLLKLF